MIYFLAISVLWAQSPPVKLACETLVLSELKTPEPSHWFQITDPSPGAKGFRSPTGKFGTWYELHQAPKTTLLMRLSEDKVETFFWNEKCEVSKSNGRWGGRGRLKSGEKLFRDKELSEVLKSGRKGMIYVWTPGMVYSGQQLPAFEAAAKKNGLEFTAVLGGESNLKTAQAVANQYSFPLNPQKLFSLELMMRSVSGHYPKTWIYRNGKLTLHPLLGIFNEAALERHIDAAMKELE